MSTIRTHRGRRAALAVAATVLLTAIAAFPAAAAEGTPFVESTTPADGDVDVAVNATLTVTFSEPVTVTDGWFRIDCGASLEHAAAASGGPQTWTINPTHDFAAGESCALATLAAAITDDEDIHPLSNGLFVFTVAGEPGSVPAPTPTFTGFMRPTKALPEMNKARAGTHIRIKFHVDGDHREVVSVGSQAYPCGTTPPEAATVPVVVRGKKAVTYNRRTDTYSFDWKTNRSWKNSCRVLVVALDDGQTQAIAFRFK